ncbi:hypothetical protein D3C71_1623070 [compost metagenome]
MAAGEDQAQAVVGQQLFFAWVLRVAVELHAQVRLGTVETGASAQRIDGLEAPGGNQPRPRVIGDTVALPALDGDEEGIVHGFLGQVEITQQADQRRQDAPRLPPVHRLDLGAHLHQCRHQSGIRWVTTSTRRSRLSPQPWWKPISS